MKIFPGLPSLSIQKPLASGTLFFKSNHPKPPQKVEASNSTADITSQADWDAGTKDNIDSSSSPGSIKISTLNQGTKLTPASIASCWDQAGTGKTIDGDTGTYWGNIAEDPNCGPEITYDFSSVKTFSSIKYYGTYALVNYSTNGTDWTQPTPFDLQGVGAPPLVETTFTPFQARYIRLEMAGLFIRETEFYSSGAIATHTTGATQIDGGENFWEWQTFTDSKTTPANTSVSYRFRTSTNDTDWTGWVGSIGAVTSRTGDPSTPIKYRYLQIEATLSNTDGVSTPTINSYSIGYHTNRPPNKPVAGTAIIGN